jgi:hypothetical protein
MAKNQKQEEVKTKNNISKPLSHKNTRGQKHNYTIKIHSAYECVAAMFFFFSFRFFVNNGNTIFFQEIVCLQGAPPHEKHVFYERRTS